MKTNAVKASNIIGHKLEAEMQNIMNAWGDGDLATLKRHLDNLIRDAEYVREEVKRQLYENLI